MTSTPGAEMSGFRMLLSARLGPRDEKSAITGAMTPGTWAAGLNDAVAPAVPAYASTAAESAAARCTVGTTYGCRICVLEVVGVFWMIIAVPPAVFTELALLTSTL